MSAHQPILPSKAVERVEAAGLPEAHSLLAEFAAAGLVKSYALARVTTPAGQEPSTVRDAAIPAEIWKRIVKAGKAEQALVSGTVRLAGSELVGGDPEVQITGISFGEGSLSKVLARYCSKQKAVATPMPKADSTIASPTDLNGDADRKTPPPIIPGDLVASVAQTMQVTGLGRTKINELMNDGTLVRRKMGRRTLIAVESIERLVGSRIR